MRFALFLLALGLASPEDPEAVAHARKSYELSRQGKTAEAEQEIRESIRLAPENPLYHSALAGLVQKTGNLEEAKAEFEQALDSNLNETLRSRLSDSLEQVDLELGAQLGTAGRYSAGLAVATDAARRFPKSARVFQMLGFFETKRQLNLNAVKSYSRALELDPSSTEASVGLGMAQSAAGMPTEAQRTLEAGIARFPRDAMHYQALGVVLLQLSESGEADPTRARAMFEAALKINPALAESHYQLGNLALQKGDLNAAKEHLQLAEKSAPDDSRIHFAMSRLYRREGNTAAAQQEMAAFQKAKAK